MRKLATVRRIDEINPIPDADAIEVATIGGWQVVVKKGDFVAGELAIYFEIDSWIPKHVAPFLCRSTEREYGGVVGEKLRTIRLRKQLSQGLLLHCWEISHPVQEGDDLTDELGIQLWEATVNAQLAGLIKGNFPTVIPKTNQERVQNLSKVLPNLVGEQFERTEKLEGSSMTCYLLDGVFGVCSRNLDLKEDGNNSFWATAQAQGVEHKMREAELDGYAIQGELIGPGIQGNIYKLDDFQFRVFDVYSVKAGMYLLPKDRQDLIYQLGLDHVPVMGIKVMVDSMQEIIATGEGVSLLNGKQEREGVVYKSMTRDYSFKVISNKYLLKS